MIQVCTRTNHVCRQLHAHTDVITHLRNLSIVLVLHLQYMHQYLVFLLARLLARSFACLLDCLHTLICVHLSNHRQVQTYLHRWEPLRADDEHCMCNLNGHPSGEVQPRASDD